MGSASKPVATRAACHQTLDLYSKTTGTQQIDSNGVLQAKTVAYKTTCYRPIFLYKCGISPLPRNVLKFSQECTKLASYWLIKGLQDMKRDVFLTEILKQV